jgi:aspartyl-tRNA(Asn)/glutamyl-tRNA(Gln) amidotransferase subunit A
LTPKTIVETHRLIKAGKTTPTELVEEAMSRIAALEPRLSAWVTVDEAGARRAAAKLTEEAEEGRLRSPLHGVTVGVKDIFNTKGLRTTMGSPLFADNVSDSDAAIVAKLRDLGAIILGKTHTTEFASHDPAPTWNPWNTRHTPGGSSSGSAAAIAAGMCGLALGSQTGGSVTRPASYCGIVGVKPTYDLLSREGVYPLSWTLDHVGFFTRCVSDAEAVLSALTGLEKSAAARRPPRIGVPDRYFNEKADPDASEGFRSAVDRLAKKGAEITTLRLPKSFDHAHSTHRVIMSAEAAAVHERLFAREMPRYRPYIRGQVASGLLIPAPTYLSALRIRRIYRDEINRAIAPFDAVATPSTTTAAPEGIAWTGDPAFNSPWSLSGSPSVTVPSGLSAGGLPLGLQLAAQSGHDMRLLSIAKWCEGALGFDKTPTIE